MASAWLIVPEANSGSVIRPARVEKPAAVAATAEAGAHVGSDGDLGA